MKYVIMIILLSGCEYITMDGIIKTSRNFKGRCIPFSIESGSNSGDYCLKYKGNRYEERILEKE